MSGHSSCDPAHATAPVMVDTNLYSTPTWIFCICLDPLVLDVITFPIPVLRRLLQ